VAREARVDAKAQEQSRTGFGGRWIIVVGKRRIRPRCWPCRRYADAHRRESRNHSQRGRSLRRQPGDVLCFRQGKHHIGLT
jgi:hypothetical protein